MNICSSTRNEAAHDQGRTLVNDGSLEIRDVTVRFGGLTALDAVSLTAAPRQVTGIIGPNGAGKTTLLNVLCGFVKPQLRDGQRSAAASSPGCGRTGSPPWASPARCRASACSRGLTVTGERHGRRHRHARAGVLVRAVRAGRVRPGRAAAAGPGAWRRWTGWAWPTWPTACPDTLSYGLRKRVALARALVARPRLLLLDEPASGLSEDELPELGDLITQLADDAGVVVIEHRMDLMMSVCDTIFVLDFGKLIATGTPEQVQADPAVTAAYLGAEETSRAGRAERGGATGSRSGRGARRRLAAGGGRRLGGRASTRPGVSRGTATAGSSCCTASRRRPAGHDHRGARRQRRGQDHAAAHDQRARPAPAGPDRAGRRPTWPGAAPRTSPGPGWRTCPRARA